MISIGIESTAHTFGVGVAEGTKILANERDMFRPPAGMGMNPTDVGKHHVTVKDKILEAALKKANIALKDAGIISYSAGPGLPPCLRVGLEFAKQLAKESRAKLMEVNHCVAHMEIGKLCTGARDPIMLYASGGNTQVIGYAQRRYRVFGETLDVPVGNALDVFARSASLPFPGGPEIERLARNGKYVELPYVVKGMDLSFSGIVTAATKMLKAQRLEDVCFSMQETVFAMLVEIVERAMAHTEKKELLLVGGVAANARLKEMCKIMCEERGAMFYPVPMEYAGDCGANIAWTGLLQYEKGCKPTPASKADFYQKWRTDEVEVTWV